MTIPAELKEAHPRLLALNSTRLTLNEYHETLLSKFDHHPTPAASVDTLNRAVKLVTGGLPEDISRQWVSSGEAAPWISFAEHHASISHPESTNVVANLATMAGGHGASVRTLSCGTIPLDNELFPRGVVIQDHLFPLSSNRQRRHDVIHASPWDTKEARTRIHKRLMIEPVGQELSSTVIEWFDEITPQIEDLPHLWQQITVMNRDLGHRMFEGEGITYTSL